MVKRRSVTVPSRIREHWAAGPPNWRRTRIHVGLGPHGLECGAPATARRRGSNHRNCSENIVMIHRSDRLGCLAARRCSARSAAAASIELQAHAPRRPVRRAGAPTLGGGFVWSDEVIYDDWRIQKHAVIGHYRLIDPQAIAGSVRRVRDLPRQARRSQGRAEVPAAAQGRRHRGARAWAPAGNS